MKPALLYDDCVSDCREDAGRCDNSRRKNDYNAGLFLAGHWPEGLMPRTSEHDPALTGRDAQRIAADSVQHFKREEN